jgi:hypothetical protein
MKTLKSLSIFVFGTLMGTLAGFVLFFILARPDANNAGEGFAALGFGALSFFVSSCASLALATTVFDKRKGTESKSGQVPN